MAQGLQLTLVTVFSTMIVRLVQQASLAAGGSKLHAWPLLTVLLLAHVSTGGLVFTTVTVWLHLLLLPQASVNSQVRVMTHGQGALLVTVLTTGIVTLLPQQEEPTGRSNVQ